MKIKDLTVQDLHNLRAAEGWLGLGDVVSTRNELEEMTDVFCLAISWTLRAEFFFHFVFPTVSTKCP